LEAKIVPTPEELAEAKTIEDAASAIMDVMTPLGDRMTPRQLGTALGTVMGCFKLSYGATLSQEFLIALNAACQAVTDGTALRT
jgi:hypothetical protein